MIAIIYWIAAILPFILIAKMVSAYKNKPIKKYEVSFTTFLSKEVHTLDVNARTERGALWEAKQWQFVDEIIDCREVSE